MFKSKNYDKAPMQSKKFLAYMFTNIVMKIYMFYCTMKGESDMVVMTLLVCSSFIDVGYILGQASLDRFVRVANIMHGKNVEPQDS
jgi:succinate-acetate transporter protein